MGIEDLNKLVKDECPAARFLYPFSSFKGHRIAVDAMVWLFANASVARREVIDRCDVASMDPSEDEIRKSWLNNLCRFIIKFEREGVGLVFVFDGVPIPEKAATRLKRRDEKEVTRRQCQELKDHLRSLDPLQRSDQDVERLRTLMRGSGSISKEDLEIMEQVLLSVGVPCIRALADAEQLCAILAREGKVAAVFSTDTDALAFGCPVLIHRFETGSWPLMCECTRLDVVLRDTGLTFRSFVDLCILMGCDFNTRIRGIGPKKSIKYIREHQYIENIPRNDKECLNFERCREIFRIQPSEQLLHIQDLSRFENPGNREAPTSDPTFTLSSDDPFDVRTPDARALDHQTPEPSRDLPLNITSNLNMGGADFLKYLGLGTHIPTLLELCRKLPVLKPGRPADLQLLHPLGVQLIIE